MGRLMGFRSTRSKARSAAEKLDAREKAIEVAKQRMASLKEYRARRDDEDEQDQ